jgi:hypothetical protein
MPTALVSRIAAFAVATMLLLLPAIWNGFPLLFYDTGAYLGRAFFDTLSPGRSAVYGFFLGAGHWWNFWPAVIAQSFITVWTVSLFLRIHDLGHRPIVLAAVIALFTLATGLPWIAGQLMPDLFAGLAVIALYLLVFRADVLARWERLALVTLLAFSASIHNATLAVVAVMLIAGVTVRFFKPQLVPALGLIRVAAAIALSVAMLLTANFAVTGRIAWTPGGSAFIFSRLVHDGIAHRFLEDNCPDPRYELCKYRARLPHHANDFLWHDGDRGAFVAIGGFNGGADEMREITLKSLWQYPWLHLTTAIQSTVTQLFAVGTGWGIVHDVWDAYGHIEHLTPKAVPAAHSAKQRFGQLRFETINMLHQPVAWISMAILALFLLLAWRLREFRSYAPVAATFSVALLANAFVCGVLSNPHDRYGSRIAWIATLFVAVALARAVPALRTRPSEPVPAPAAVVTVEAANPEPQLSYIRQKIDRP